MRRGVVCALLILAMACGDATAPSQRTACYAYIDLIGRDGCEYRVYDRFDPCPSDSALEANGWHRSLNPIWGPR